MRGQYLTFGSRMPPRHRQERRIRHAPDETSGRISADRRLETAPYLANGGPSPMWRSVERTHISRASRPNLSEMGGPVSDMVVATCTEASNSGRRDWATGRRSPDRHPETSPIYLKATRLRCGGGGGVPRARRNPRGPFSGDNRR